MLILARLHRSSHNKSLHWKILCSYGFLGLDFDTVTVVGRSKPTLSSEQESRHFDFGWAEFRHFGSLPTVTKRLTLSRVGSHTMKLSDRSSFQFLASPVTLFRYAFYSTILFQLHCPINFHSPAQGLPPVARYFSTGLGYSPISDNADGLLKI